MPLILIAAGFLITNFNEIEEMVVKGPLSADTFAFGLACGIIQLVLWTWYSIKNADWLQAHEDTVQPSVWTCAQLVPLLPAGLALYIMFACLNPDMDSIFGERPVYFTGVSIYSGVVVGFIAAVFFNICSAKVPTQLLGQLMIFETVFAIFLGLLWDARLPGPTLIIGVSLLLCGVLVSLRIFSKMNLGEGQGAKQ